jgi:hypothetical protein
MDLAKFPDMPPPEWMDAGCDRLEFQLQLLDVGYCKMGHGMLPVETALSVLPLENRRLEVAARSSNFEFNMTCYGQMRIGRINAYRSDDPSVRFQSTALGKKLWRELPDPYTRVYYESL